MAEAVLAFLSAVGISAIVWIVADALFSRREKTIHASVLLPLSGAAEDMEYAASGARHALRQMHGDGVVLLVDCGMDAESLRRAGLLAGDLNDVKLVCPEEIGELY